MTEQHESHESWTDEQKWNYLLRHERLGELLVRHGNLSIEQLDEALKEQAKSKKKKHLGELIVNKKFLTLDEIISTLDKQRHNAQTGEQTIQQLKKKKKE